MFELRQKSEGFSDATAFYDVVFDKKYTVKEFISEILTRNEWGSISTEKDGEFYGEKFCEYRQNTLKVTPPAEILNKKILSAWSHGGWGNMDYIITLESKNINKEKKTMIYTTLTIGGEEFKLRLTTAKMVELEKKYGANPLSKLSPNEGLPKIGDLMIIFHAMLTQYQHNIPIEQAYALYDQYIEDGRIEEISEDGAEKIEKNTHNLETFLFDVIFDALYRAGYVSEKPEMPKKDADKSEAMYKPVETGDTEKNE